MALLVRPGQLPPRSAVPGRSTRTAPAASRRRTRRTTGSRRAARPPPRLARQARAGTAAGRATAIDVAAGQRALVLKLGGSGGDPVVTLFAPDGTKYAMSGVEPGQAERRLLRARGIRSENATIVGVRAPQAGRWEIVPQLGSVPIATLSSAADPAQARR